jgi:SET and MYND domain-containing protein
MSILLRELCNGFCFWDEEYEKYAIAIVPSASYFNHTCLPNAFKMNINGKIYIHALVEIQPYEEITFSYLPSNYDTITRNDILSTYFGFTCTCIRCMPSNELTSSDKNKVLAFENDIVHECGGIWHQVLHVVPSINNNTSCLETVLNDTTTASISINTQWSCSICKQKKTT